MGKEYDYHKREGDVSWILTHCNVLLQEAKKYNNTSMVFYAALEARTLLEKTELDLMLMSTERSEWEGLVKMAKGKNGLSRSNSKYKTLKYRYQTFSEAYAKVVLSKMELKVFDYKKSEELQSELAEYIHVYTRTPDELIYSSEYVQIGIVTVNKVLEFVKSYFTVVGKDYVFGVINFSTLQGSAKKEFEDWKSSVSEDTDGLYERLKEINEKEFGGEQAKLVE